jgi:geranylgeranyl diphosphate synthase type 3
MEIHWRDNFLCPTEDEYHLMISRKTGALFDLPVRLMQLFSHCEENFISLTNLLGCYKQIHNDYIDLQTHNTYKPNYKVFAEDITEGKCSFPILHCVRTSDQGDDRLLRILQQRTEDIEVKRSAIALIEATGSFAYTREAMGQLDGDIRAEVKALRKAPSYATCSIDWSYHMFQLKVYFPPGNSYSVTRS